MRTRDELASIEKPANKNTETLAVVLNWNELDWTLRCIDSLLSQSTTDFDILVVDNHSQIDPTTFLRKKFPSINLVRNHENLGVAGGRNVGLEYALKRGYRYVLLLDNDARADTRMLERLVKAADKYRSAALFGPKIFRLEKPDTIWRAGCTSWKWTYLHTGFHIVKQICSLTGRQPPGILDTLRGEGKPDKGQYDQIRDIPFQIGCAQLIRLSALEKVGLLDDMFSPYGSEDIDFCARLTKAGWKIKFIPQAFCWHRTESSFTDNYYRSFFNSRHIILVSRKHLHPLYFSFLFVPDFLFLTVPLIMIENLVFRQKKRLLGFLDGIKWNLADAKKRGVLPKDRQGPRHGAGQLVERPSEIKA